MRAFGAVQRWGFKDVWLHTEVSNAAAIQLYRSMGYEEVKRDPPFFGPFQRILFRKGLKARAMSPARGEKLLASTTKERTYIWDVTSKK